MTNYYLVIRNDAVDEYLRMCGSVVERVGFLLCLPLLFQ